MPKALSYPSVPQLTFYFFPFLRKTDYDPCAPPNYHPHHHHHHAQDFPRPETPSISAPATIEPIEPPATTRYWNIQQAGHLIMQEMSSWLVVFGRSPWSLSVRVSETWGHGQTYNCVFHANIRCEAQGGMELKARIRTDASAEIALLLFAAWSSLLPHTTAYALINTCCEGKVGLSFIHFWWCSYGISSFYKGP